MTRCRHKTFLRSR